MNVDAVPVSMEPHALSAPGKHTMDLNPCCLTMMTPDMLLVMYAGVHLDSQVRLGHNLTSDILSGAVSNRNTIQWLTVTHYSQHERESYTE